MPFSSFPHFDVIVVGAGHAGCEAAHASAKMGAKTLLVTMNLDTIAKMSCNPAIGGTGKGQMVREIDSMGGIMGKMADRCAIQKRMLNRSKGPAVWSPRAQIDKAFYSQKMKEFLEKIDNLSLFQGTTEAILVNKGRVSGVRLQEGIEIYGHSVVLSAGTFMQGRIHIGALHFSSGRAGDPPSIGLSKSLKELGFSLGRLKTGTPCRIHRRSIDFSRLEEQPGEEDVFFSYDPPKETLPQIPCHITYTSLESKEIVEESLHLSASSLHSFVGPRYCPSIEDKVKRFQDKERHQIFVEPEGLNTEEIYLNGISTSLPFDVQLRLIHSIPGFEKAEVTRAAYAIEYDYLLSGQIGSNLESHSIENLFFAGQINGTTGYEEAAAQGFIAGVNAVRKARQERPFILKPSESYIGVMIEDITTTELSEPYRMFTSRAMHRLLLRQDNADLRLGEYGYQLGLLNLQEHQLLQAKKANIEEVKQLLEKSIPFEGKSATLRQLLARPNFSYESLSEIANGWLPKLDPTTQATLEMDIKYAGYIQRQEQEVERLSRLDTTFVPEGMDLLQVKGLRRETLEILKQVRPKTLGQLSRLSGITPADLSILQVAVKAFCERKVDRSSSSKPAYCSISPS